MENGEVGQLPENQLQNQQTDGYFDAFKSSFKRILNNKILWVWGIFISTGGSFFSGMGDEAGNADGKMEDFLNEFWWIFLILGAGALVIGIALWIFSTIVRPGVIRALDRLQNNSKSEVKHRDIWDQGVERFKEVLKFDVIIFLIIMAGLIIVALVGVVVAVISISLYVQKVENLWVFLPIVIIFLVLIIAFFLMIVVLGIIKTVGAVFISLGNMNWSTVLKTSYQLIKNNKMETFKLFLILILIGIVGGLVGAIVLGVVAGILITASVSLIGALKPAGILLSVVAGLVIFAAFLFLKSFLSLWSQDVIVWWVKKMQGVKIPQEKEQKEAEEIVEEESQTVEVAPQGDLVLENER